MKKSLIFLSLSALILFSCKRAVQYSDIAMGGAGQIASSGSPQISYVSNASAPTSNVQIMYPMDSQTKEIFRDRFMIIPGPGWIQRICIQKTVTITTVIEKEKTIIKWVKEPCPEHDGTSGSDNDGMTTVPRESVLTPDNAAHMENIDTAIDQGFYNPAVYFHGDTLINIPWDPTNPSEENPFLGDGIPDRVKAEEEQLNGGGTTTSSNTNTTIKWGPCQPGGPGGGGGGTTGTGGWLIPGGVLVPPSP